MKSGLKLILFLFCSQLLFSQENEQRITIEFNNINRVEALRRLSSAADLKIYFYQNWFSESVITRSYNNEQVTTILEDLLKGTTVNYFYYPDKQYILTKNNIIYEELPEGFFGSEKKIATVDDTSDNSPPVFYAQSSRASNKKIETIRIGKEQRSGSRKSLQLSGTITNLRSAEPIPDMSILSQSNTLLGVTDFDGSYAIRIPAGSNILKFSALGFEKGEKEIIIFNDGLLNLTFDESIEQLDEVVVEGDLYKNIEEVSSGSEQVDSEESKTIPLVLGERDVMKVATALPGISTTGEGSTGFNVRGGRSDQNLILLDGATIYNPQHFFGIFSAINPFSIGKLEVFKGNIPPRFGGRLSSVFEMHSRERDHHEFRGEASVGPVTSNLVVDIPVFKDKSSLMVGGRAAYANWILRQLDDESLQNSSASFYDGVVNYAHDINPDDQLKATAYYSNDDFSISSDSLFAYNNRMVSLQWQHRFNDKNVGVLQLTNSYYGFNIEYDRGENNDFDLGYSINETTLKLDLNHIHSTRWKLNYGIEGKLYTSDPGYIKPLNSASSVEPRSLQQERALEAAAFANLNYEFSNRLAADIGFRLSSFTALGARTQFLYEQDQPKQEGSITDTLTYQANDPIKTYGGPELRLGARYLLSPSFSVKAGYNNAIQYLHVLTNNTTISPIDTWKLSDLNIKPQRGQQFSLGLFKNFDANAYEISIEGFYKLSENVLDFKTGADLLLNEKVETEILQGDGKSYGIEFLLRKNKGKLNGWLGYTYSRSWLRLDSEFEEERVNNGEFFPSNFDKPHDLSLVTNYKFTNRFSLSANFIYQTGRPVTVPVGNISFNGAEYAVYSDRNSYRIPDFYRLDLAFNIEGNHKLQKAGHSFWSISIYNALGRNNPYSVFYVTDSGKVKAYKSSIFAIPVPSITYNLKF